MQDLPIIGHISFFSGWIPLIIGLITFRRFNKEFKIFFILILVGNIIDLICSPFLFYFENLWLIEIWDLLEFSIIMIFFYNYTTSKKIKLVLKNVLIVFILLKTILFLIGYNNSLGSSSYLLIPSGLILISLSMFFLIELFRKAETLLYKISVFWLLGGISLYFTATLFFNLVTLIVEPKLLYHIWKLQATASITVNMIFAYSFYLQYKNSKPEPST